MYGKNRENSDIIHKFILCEKGVNVLTPTAQYNKNMHILTDTIGLGQFNKLHDVCLLDVKKYDNCRV